MVKESIPGINDFEWSQEEEPHAIRRRLIMKAHGKEISALFGYDWRSKYMAAATVFLQLTLAYFCGKPTCPIWVMILTAWIIGGTCVHSLTLAIHEMSHNLFFKSTLHNYLYSFFCNLPFCIPYAASFRKYHLEHHKQQGHDVIDTDIPTEWEGRFFTTPLRKFLWVFFQSFFYALRPVISNPKPLNKWDIMNLTLQISFDVLLYKCFGLGSLVYLLLSVFLGLGPHPCAGHFIGEHYTNIWTGEITPEKHKSGWTPIKGEGENLQIDETFTYRGPLNWLSYNVGYHCAHHDFAYISGWRLPELERIAPEFYQHLPECKSWPGTIYRYIFSEGNPFDRVKRHRRKNKKN